MKSFEIFNWHPPHWDKPHPAVIVSHPNRAENKDMVEVVMCTSQHANRAPKSNEILLDEADGFDWPTLCKCDLIYAVPREDLKGRRGLVSESRRQQLVRTLIAAHGWMSVL
jgi:mRNA-degrading endonuclease toxin of MazEF toxin-antitoxin module